MILRSTTSILWFSNCNLRVQSMLHFSANSNEWLQIKISDSGVRHVLALYTIQFRRISAFVYDVRKRWEFATLGPNIRTIGPFNEQCATTRLFTGLYVKHERNHPLICRIQAHSRGDQQTKISKSSFFLSK